MPAESDRLIWVDLEMSGLDLERCYIIEIASLVTDNDLNVIAEGPDLVIHASDEELATLSDWCRETFGKSGLLELVRASGISRAAAEARTLEFLREYVTPGTSPLCGNSVHNDRNFLQRQMPGLHDFCHYRNIDVSTVKELVRRWYPDRFRAPPKTGDHRAMADIRESVAELRHYREQVFLPRPGPGKAPPEPSAGS
jgi:oligoribonuclease